MRRPDTTRILITTLVVLIALSLAGTALFERGRGAALFERGGGAAHDQSQAAPADQPSIVTATILQLNDVYEISPVGGDLGGLARVATLRKQLAAEDPNTFMVLAGDLFSPSALGTARAGPNRTALNGRQIVDVMNRAGMNFATFGNHEFDLGKADFEQRVKESSFTWISSNVLGADGKPLPGVPAHQIVTVTNRAGRQFRLGLFGLTIDSNKRDYIVYTDKLEAARREMAALKNDTDAVIALTHLEFEDDEAVAEALPGLAMIIGGHEHLNILARRGLGLVPIAKADANAKSVYIHRLRYDTGTRKLTIDSQWRPIDAQIADDPDVKIAVDRWRDSAYAAFRADGFEPDQVVTTINEALDGREETVRNISTPLTQLIAGAMLDAFPGSDGAIFNSGSIRIDDTLSPGPITQYDVLRVLPFGGNVMPVTVPGATLKKIMDVSLGNRNSGGYLQAAGLAAIDTGRTYRIVMNDFLLSGREVNLGFIADPASGIKQLPGAPKEMRHVVIARLTRGL